MKSKIDYKEINKLIDLLEERELVDFELETEGFKIKVARGQKIPAPPKHASSSETLHQTQSPPAFLEPEAETAKEQNSFHYITSPMVGTFYRAPDPSSDSFVEIGDDVKKNQTLCIIEAMKLMNEIESDLDGTLQDIFVENGSFVEYGEKLFSIKPHS